MNQRYHNVVTSRKWPRTVHLAGSLAWKNLKPRNQSRKRRRPRPPPTHPKTIPITRSTPRMPLIVTEWTHSPTAIAKTTVTTTLETSQWFSSAQTRLSVACIVFPCSPYPWCWPDSSRQFFSSLFLFIFSQLLFFYKTFFFATLLF